MMGHREPTIDGDEYDAFTRWRRYLCWPRGEIKRIKRRYNKRVRREAKERLRMEVLDENHPQKFCL